MWQKKGKVYLLSFNLQRPFGETTVWSKNSLGPRLKEELTSYILSKISFVHSYNFSSATTKDNINQHFPNYSIEQKEMCCVCDSVLDIYQSNLTATHQPALQIEINLPRRLQDVSAVSQQHYRYQN